MNILITLCARGGSKGIPGKNVREINGSPLISLSIRTAREFQNKHGADIALSTDSDHIKEVAGKYGIFSAYKRPENLATDNAGKIDTINDLLNFEEKHKLKKYDYVLDLDITSPLRNLQDLDDAFITFKQDKHAINLFSVNRANRNPYFNMVEVQENGYYGLVKKGHFLTRQSSPEVYELNASFYFFRREFFYKPIPTINSKSMIYAMPHICFDLDHPIDFEFMEFLMVNNKLDFIL